MTAGIKALFPSPCAQGRAPRGWRWGESIPSSISNGRGGKGVRAISDHPLSPVNFPRFLVAGMFGMFGMFASQWGSTGRHTHRRAAPTRPAA